MIPKSNIRHGRIVVQSLDKNQCIAHLEVCGEVEDGPGPAVDDLAGELLVLAQLLRVLVQVHHRLPDPGLLQPAQIYHRFGPRVP